MTGGARGGEGAVEPRQHLRDAGARRRRAVGRVAIWAPGLRDGERKPFAALAADAAVDHQQAGRPGKAPSLASSAMRSNMPACRRIGGTTVPARPAAPRAR